MRMHVHAVFLGAAQSTDDVANANVGDMCRRDVGAHVFHICRHGGQGDGFQSVQVPRLRGGGALRTHSTRAIASSGPYYVSAKKCR